jgi:Domain of unknown function (DUF4261)
MKMQLVELHFSERPNCDDSAIKPRVEAILGENIDSSDSQNANEFFLFFHTQHSIQYDEGHVPAQTAIVARHETIDLNRYSHEIQQSWGFRNCESILGKSRHTLLVTELMARLLPTTERVRLFHGVLQAVIEITKPEALVFKHSQQVVHPDAYLTRTADVPILRPGSLNVRFFNISNSEGDMLMDTRGLTEIGLHDLQCHFRGLDPDDVSRLLYNTAVYIFENGAVIESGNTVAGIDPGSKWVCQFETALVEPTRELLDLNPGAPHAAGERG